MEQEMEYIYAVYREGSISKAADKLFITQPALSMAIKRVEKRLGEALFDRSQTPICLTGVGDLYIRKYHEIKHLERELSNQIHDLQQSQKGELTIGGTHFILSYVLAPVLSKFFRQYPDISVKFFECRADTAESLLIEGSIDTYLRCDGCPPALKPIGPAFTDHLLIAVHKDYVKRYNLPKENFTHEMIQNNAYFHDGCFNVDFKHFSKLPYLVPSEGNNSRRRFFDLFSQHKVKPDVRMEVEQLATAYYLADNGIGAALASTIMIKKNLGHNLVFYKIKSPILVRHFYFAGRHNGYISKATSKFMGMLSNYYEE